MLYHIGIDSSLSCTAVAILKRHGNGNCAIVSYQKIMSDNSKKYLERCDHIVKELLKFIQPYIKLKGACQVGIETPNSFRGGEVTRKLCGLYGIILYVFHQAGVSVREVNTKHAKKVSTGKGSSDKKQTVKAINKLFGVDLKYKKTSNKEKTDDDLADALSIAYTIYKEEGENNGRSKGKIQGVQRKRV